MMPTLVRMNSTIPRRVWPRLLEMFAMTSDALPSRIDRVSSPAVMLVANWKMNAAPRYRVVRASDSIDMALNS